MNKTEQRKMIDQGKGFGNRRNHLWADEVAGRTMVTNSYWMAPAEWFADAMPLEERGTYDVKSGERLSDDVPNMERLLPDEKEEYDVLVPTLLHGGVAIVSRGFQSDLALFEVADNGSNIAVAIDRRYVEMFREMAAAAAGTELQFRQERHKPLRPISVYRSSSYTNGGTYESRTSWTLVGLIMPVRIA